MADQGKTAAAAVAAIRKTFGKVSAAALLSEGGSAGEVSYIIPTGQAVMDRYLMGCGGLPGGRVIELSGWESTGKTTLAACWMAACQRDGGVVLLQDSEYALDPEWVQTTCGVDPGALVLLEADHLEGFFEKIEAGVAGVRAKDKDRPILVVLDSVACTPTKSEIEEGLTGDAAIGEKARIMSRKFGGPIQQWCAQNNVTMVVLNQLRQKIGVMFGDSTTEPGGNALKFAASIRLRVHPCKKGNIKAGGDVIGRLVGVKVRKNKVGPSYREAKLKLVFGQGFDDAWAVVNLAKDLGLIPEGTPVDETGVAMAIQGLGWKDTQVKLLTGPTGKESED